MNTFQTAIASPRFNRVMFVLGATVLAAGIAVLLLTRVDGSDPTTITPDQNFHPTLPAKSTPLKNGNGATITKFEQLQPEVRSTIRTFLATAVARKNLGQSWAVIAPSLKSGYTYKTWKNAKALPVIPYPIDDIDKATYYLDYASTKEILVDIGLSSPPALEIRPARFRLGLVPVGTGAQKRWLVDYWMPLWTPQLPVN